MKIYVCMTGKAMSGWGRALNKKNRLAIEMDSYDDALKLAHWVHLNHPEMKYISVSKHRPKARFGLLLQFKTREDMPSWFKSAGIA